MRVEEEKYIPAKKTMTLISSFIGLFIIVIVISHMAEKVVASDLGIIIQLLVFITILLIAGFGYGYLLSRFLKVDKKKRI